MLMDPDLLTWVADPPLNELEVTVIKMPPQKNREALAIIFTAPPRYGIATR